MTITKANVATKIAVRISALADANKLTAADINELSRVTDDLVDAVNPLDPYYGGLYICDGVGTQNVAPLAEVQVNQWTNIQPQRGLSATDGDQVLTIPAGGSGVYSVQCHVTYETDSKSDELMKTFVTVSGAKVPGLCSRVLHPFSGTHTYSTDMSRLATLAAGDTVALLVTGFTFTTTRFVAIKHATLTLHRLRGA